MKNISLKKDEITALCERIDMPTEATAAICELIDGFDFSIVNEHYHKLFNAKTGQEGVNEIDAILENTNKKGYIWLAIYMAAAVETKKIYDELGIDEGIYYDTMAAFSRVVNEHKVSFGVYGYDRHWWHYRQIACVLFRVGELEYEMCEFLNDDVVLNGETVIFKGDNILSVHIPSDAKLKPELCSESMKSAVEFFDKYYKAFEYRMLYCNSWIISPNLKQVLPTGSNIVKFLEMFENCSVNHEGEGYKLWVFKNSSLSIDEYPQDTSLQRNIVAHLKQGGKIGDAVGIIRKANVKS